MTLSLCMIVKDEEEVLARALETALFADEIIIADTGSTDGTAEIARRFTDKVYSFDWCDDFSAARNFAIERATCDYWMWLDADDVITPENAAAIAALKNELDGSVDVVMLPYVLSTDGNGKPLFSYYRERIIRRRSGLKFSGRVHEAVALSGNVMRAEPFILHAKPEGRSSTRNLDIYRGMISSGVRLNRRERYYYARELYYNGRIEEAADEFAVFLDGKGYLPNVLDACVMLARCRRRLGDVEGAFMPLLRTFELALPTGEACYELGLTFFSRGEYRQAAYWLERAASALPDMESGAFIDLDYYGFLPYVWLSVCYDRLGERDRAYRWHCRAKKLKPNHPSVISNEEYFASLGAGNG